MSMYHDYVEKPGRVEMELSLAAVALGTSLFFLTLNLMWTAILFCVISAAGYKVYTGRNKAYTALLVVNNWASSVRAVTEIGWFTKSPFEQVAREINLHRPAIHKQERFSTLGADRIVKLTLNISPEISGNSSRNLARWALFEHRDESSITPEAIVTDALAKIRTILSPYFEEIQDDVALEVPNAKKVLETRNAKELLRIFCEEHGACMKILIEDIARTREEEELRARLSSITEVTDATKALMDTGYTREKAEEFIKLRTLDNTHQILWKIDAPPTMTHFAPVMAGGNPASGTQSPRKRKP